MCINVQVMFVFASKYKSNPLCLIDIESVNHQSCDNRIEIGIKLAKNILRMRLAFIGSSRFHLLTFYYIDKMTSGFLFVRAHFGSMLEIHQNDKN